MILAYARRRAARLPSAAMLLACLAAHGAEAKAQRSCLVVASQNLATACSSIAPTELGQLITGPALAPLRQELRQRNVAAPLNPKPVFGLDWQELAAVDHAAALIAFELPGDGLGLALSFPSGAAGADADIHAEQARHAFLAGGYQMAPVRDRSSSISIFSRGDQTRAIVRSEAWVAIVNSAEAARQLVSGGDRVAASMQALKDSGSDAAAVFVSVQPWPLAKASRSESQQTSASDAVQAAERVGWDKLTAVNGTLRASASEGFEWQGDLAIYAARPFELALRLLDFKAGPLPDAPPPLSGDWELESAAAYRWDVGEAMQGYATLFDDANEPGPAGRGLFDDLLLGLLEDPEGPQVDLRRDVFQNLGPAMMRLVAQGPGGRPESLYVIEVRNPPTVLKAVQRYYAGDEQIAHRVAAGYEVWTAPPRASLFIEGESDSVLAVRGLALGDDKMLLSTSDAMLSDALAGSEQLAGGEAWQRLKIPTDTAEDVCFRGAWDQAACWQDAYAQALSNGATPLSLAAQVWRLLLFGTTTYDARLSAKAPAYGSLRAGLSWATLTLTPTQQGYSGKLRF